MRLYDDQGNRLYLNAEERAAFLYAARQRPARDRTICETLHFTGCRPSELIEAGIPDAPHRTVKGLRHGYGINAVVKGIPLHMLQKWLGHAQLSTTTIYADAVGKEEQDIASRMWG